MQLQKKKPIGIASAPGSWIKFSCCTLKYEKEQIHFKSVLNFSNTKKLCLSESI